MAKKSAPQSKTRQIKTSTKIRVQVVLEGEVAEKVDELAQKYDMSRSYFCARTIEDGVDSWVHDIVFSRLMSPLRKYCKRVYGEMSRKQRDKYLKALEFMIRENIEELTTEEQRELGLLEEEKE